MGALFRGWLLNMVEFILGGERPPEFPNLMLKPLFASYIFKFWTMLFCGGIGLVEDEDDVEEEVWLRGIGLVFVIEVLGVVYGVGLESHSMGMGTVSLLLLLKLENLLLSGKL